MDIEYTFDRVIGQNFQGTVKQCLKFIESKAKQNDKEVWIRIKDKEYHYAIVRISIDKQQTTNCIAIGNVKCERCLRKATQKLDSSWLCTQHFNHLKCVNCGFCCKQVPCLFGQWNKSKTQCKHLTKDNHCGIYKEIITTPHWKSYPAFGQGCCSNLNSDRAAIIKRSNNRSSIDSSPASRI